MWDHVVFNFAYGRVYCFHFYDGVCDDLCINCFGLLIL